MATNLKCSGAQSERLFTREIVDLRQENRSIIRDLAGSCADIKSLSAIYYAAQQAEMLRKVVPLVQKTQQTNFGVHEMQFSEETNHSVKMTVDDICVPGVELFTALKIEELMQLSAPVFITVQLSGVLEFGDSICRAGGGSAVILIGKGVAWVIV